MQEEGLQQPALSCGPAKAPRLPVGGLVVVPAFSMALGDNLGANPAVLAAHAAAREGHSLLYGHHLEILQT
jgi:hypothetical protein